MPKKRTSLLDQAVSQLLEDLADGIYLKQLPGERTLAERLGVSRPVLRSALEILENQGWIQAPGPNKARVVLKRPEPRNEEVRKIGILVPQPLPQLASDDVVLVTSLMRYCEEKGWRCLLFPIDQWGPQHLELRLDELLETSPCDIWVAAPLANIRAFGLLHQRGEKLIAIGCTAVSWNFGAIQYDLDSANAHALGVMLRAGRKNIIRPYGAKRLPDTVERTAKLLSEFGISYREDFHLPMFDGSREGFLRLLDSLFAQTPRPDGIIIQYIPGISALLVEGWLMERRLRFPDDVSVIQIGSDNFLGMMHRPVDHYTTDAEPLLEATYSALDHFFTTGECLSGNRTLQMTYVKGESV
ncbi:hypothetical protein NT6N_05160 [Oceaniferula spumae]|uniref:HTH gntR-type domain-containing protein n=1 Tax=Oceaniferula spumae TaxID=2979115 RepID=A0AAT9FHL4_9BACT